MNKLFTVMALALICTGATAQTDSVAKSDTVILPAKSDTIRVGNIVILTDGNKHHDDDNSDNIKIEFGRHKEKNLSNVSTNWLIFDFGFENYTDKTNYATATVEQYLVNAPGTSFPLGASDFKLKTSKSINVNIWLFMQRLNLVDHRLNLIYGLGIEFNNYVYYSNITFKQAGYTPYSTPASVPHYYVIRDSIAFNKDKLATNYVTVPLMLNYSTKPGYHNKGFNFSAGVSIGYLYNSRNKQKSSERGNLKNFGDYGLRQWQFAYVAELGLGPVKLYGSYTPASIFEEGFDMRSYAIGIRLGFW
jgi:hypothetical protein